MIDCILINPPSPRHPYTLISLCLNIVAMAASAQQLSSEFYGASLLSPPGRPTSRTLNDKHSSKRGWARSDLPELVKQLGQSLWGKGLPPGALVGAVRSVWTTGWTVMMKQLAPSDPQGSYSRPRSQFRHRLPQYPVSASDHGRYHVYVSLTCPWAHRVAIVHALKGLGDAVPMSVVVPDASTGMWVFMPLRTTTEDAESTTHPLLVPTEDRAHRLPRLLDVYKLRSSGYDGRATVPMLWDSYLKEVVNNESADIIEILNSDFNTFALDSQLDLAPPRLRKDIDRWNAFIYPKVNNGVYRCGFAQGQEAYEEALEELFSALDILEEHLRGSRFLCGDEITLADVRLFTTLYRFDPAYHVLFKCSKRKISEYPNLYGYLRDIYQIPSISKTCDLQAIMNGYYKVLFPLNPGGISPGIPFGSETTSLNSSHNREKLSSIMKLSSMP